MEEVPAGGHDKHEEAKVVREICETRVLSGLRKVIIGVEGGKGRHIDIPGSSLLAARFH